MSETPRRSFKTNDGFGPAVLSPTQDVPLALDNLVCVECGRALGRDMPVKWVAVSSPKRKGMVAFACVAHVSQAMNWIGKAFEFRPVSGDVKLPDEKNN